LGGAGGSWEAGTDSFSKVKAGIVHPLAVELRHSLDIDDFGDHDPIEAIGLAVVNVLTFPRVTSLDDKQITANRFALPNARRFFFSPESCAERRIAELDRCS
jgi:hypothetical protein